MSDRAVSETQLTAWQSQRRVRAAAYVQPGPPLWAGSLRRVLVFERRAQAAGSVPQSAESLTLPFEPLEKALSAAQHGEDTLKLLRQLASEWHIPARWLGRLEPLYDPARALEGLGRLDISEAQWRLCSLQLVQQGQQQLAQEQHRRAGGAAALRGLLLARQVALQQAYPALAAWQRSWPKGGLRLTHHWRADLSLSAPHELSLLEGLYGFGGEAEARRLLTALRGMGMLHQERQARLAIQHGYYDGATRFIRDEAARQHAGDLQRWTLLAPARRERLGLLLGLERSPLGASALEQASRLLDQLAERQRQSGR